MDLSTFYSNAEYNTPLQIKFINGINIIDLRAFEEFELLFLTATPGGVRFKKKFNENNPQQLTEILFEDYKYGGIINSKGELVLNDVQLKIQQDEHKNINERRSDAASKGDPVSEQSSRSISGGEGSSREESFEGDLFSRYLPSDGEVRDSGGILSDEGTYSEHSDIQTGAERLNSFRSRRNDSGRNDESGQRRVKQFQHSDRNARNFIINDGTFDSRRNRFLENINALRVLIQIEKEDRIATDEEKSILAKYSGFGGLADILFHPDSYPFRNLGFQMQEYIRTIYSIIDEFKEENRERILGSIKSSTLTAYYTPIEIIKGIYDVLGNAEYNGGNILEPSMGSGFFLGTMPEKFKNSSNLYGVELDYLTGKIAKELYPDANIQIKGFEETQFPNNHFDMIIGNIPFGDLRVVDKSWKHSANPIYQFSQRRIHNYFVVKNLELTRPGGITAIITSAATLDSPSNRMVRQHIADNAEFLGAIRLPNTAFKESNTEVVADILFLRKFHVGEEKKQKYQFLDLAQDTVKHKREDTEYDVEYNEFFYDHPEMMLGTPAAGGQYRAEDFTLLADDSFIPLRERIQSKAKFIIPDDLKFGEFLTKKEEQKADEIEQYKGFDKEIVRDGNIVIQNGKTGYIRIQKDDIGNDKLIFEANTFGKVGLQRSASFIRLRSTLTELMLAELYDNPDEQIESLRETLNLRYNQFKNSFGNLNSKDNFKFIVNDINVYTILALEKLNDKKEVVGLADIFHKRTISPKKVITKADSPEDAINISLNELGVISPSKMELLLGEEWEKKCQGLIFENPTKQGTYFSKEEYLSGDVRIKLQQAKAASTINKDYNNNIRALEDIYPLPIPTPLIDMRIGARWIPIDDYSNFFKDLFSLHKEKENTVLYNSGNDTYTINGKDMTSAISTVYAGGGKDGIYIAEAALQDKYIKIFYKDKDNNSIFDKKNSQAANQKAEQIKQEFQKWLLNNPKIKERLAERYNAMFNSVVLPKYDGSILTFPGYMGPELRQHQKDATYRLLRQHGGLLHHCVGSGKTLAMQTTIMEMKRLGIAKKPMIIAIKSTVQQISNSFKKVYPFANILSPTEKDFEKKNRNKFLGKIAVNDWDCVILSHEQYCMLKHDPDIENSLIQEEIRLLQATVEGLTPDGTSSNLNKLQIKRLEKRIANLIAKNKEVLSRPQDEFTFEKLGIDHLMVDESQFFKNLPFTTKHSNVSGLGDPNGSQKTRFLLMGCMALHRLYGEDKGITFASGTPISNSLVELYLINRYLCPDSLQEKGLVTFDAWASVFAERSTEIEFSVTGELKMKDRFRKYTNVPELSKMYAVIADVKQDRHINLPKPGLKIEMIASDLSPDQARYMEEIIRFAKCGESKTLGLHGEGMKTAKMLVATTLSAKVAMDIRLLNPDLEDESTSKVSMATRNIAKIYKETTEHKGVQLVFSDLGTPSEKFNVYDELKRKLIEDYNIPEHEVAFIHDAKNAKQKESIFNRASQGAIRVLLGSTQKMGTGVNIQDKIVAMHHLDVPWTPASFEQRNGRGARQGNIYAELYNNNEVNCYVYAVKRSLDSYKYQLLEIKQNIMNQVTDGTIVERYVDEGTGGILGFAEFASELSCEPIILEKANLEKLINTLETSRRIFEEEKYRNSRHLKSYEHKLEVLCEEVSNSKRDLELFKKNGFGKNPDNSYNYHVQIDGKMYSKPSDAGKILLDKVNKNNLGKVLTGYGVDLYLHKVRLDTWADPIILYSIKGPSGVTYGDKELSEDPTHAGMSIISAIEGAERLAKKENQISGAENQIKLIKESAVGEWDGLEELETSYTKLKEIKDRLENAHNENEENEENTTDIEHEEMSSIPKKKEEIQLSNFSATPHDSSKSTSQPVATITQAKSTTGKDMFLVTLGVTFAVDIYKKMVEPIFKADNGLWSKRYKAFLFFSNENAESFKSSISTKVLTTKIPIESWKTPKAELKQKAQVLHK